MSVKIESGMWVAIWRHKKASTAFAKGQFVDLVSGYIQPSTSSTALIFGVNQDNLITSASENYADTDLIPVMVPRGGTGLVRATVTGTFANTNEGDQLDLSTSLVVDADASTTDATTCVRYISATEGVFAINPQLR